MTTQKTEQEIIPATVQRYYMSESLRVISSNEWKSLIRAYEGLHKKAIDAKSFDPRFNAVHWAIDAHSLCKQIAYGYCWMKAYGKFYKKKVTPGSQPAHVDFHVTYFADNCITRIDSCRDKLALLVWAFYCPFNPERRNEVLEYLSILERLEHPVRFALKLSRPGDFLDALKLLEGNDFSRIEIYRNLKIHRREPRIEIYGVASHHDWSYLFPLTKSREIEQWEAALEQAYPDPEFRERIKKNCYINGVPFENRKIRNQLWSFDDVQRKIESCLFKLFRASDKCFRILSRRLSSGRVSKPRRRI